MLGKALLGNVYGISSLVIMYPETYRSYHKVLLSLLTAQKSQNCSNQILAPQPCHQRDSTAKADLRCEGRNEERSSVHITMNHESAVYLADNAQATLFANRHQVDKSSYKHSCGEFITPASTAETQAKARTRTDLNLAPSLFGRETPRPALRPYSVAKPEMSDGVADRFVQALVLALVRYLCLDTPQRAVKGREGHLLYHLLYEYRAWSTKYSSGIIRSRRWICQYGRAKPSPAVPAVPVRGASCPCGGYANANVTCYIKCENE